MTKAHGQISRVVIYARVSLDVTGEGRSVERQLEACRKLCELRGWTVVAELVDNSISAWSGKERPAWNQVLAMIESGEVDFLAAWHLDRMTRSMIDLENLILRAEAAGVGVATATGDIDLTTDMGRMIARILAAVARAEVERKAARQRLANAQRAADGISHYGGARPFGYDIDFTTVIEEEADALRDAAEKVLAGASLRSIVRDLTKRGLASSRSKESKTGAAWTPGGVRRMLVNPRYAGVRIYNGDEVAEGKWEKILDLETHLQLLAKYTDPTRSSGRLTGRAPTTLLTAIGRCWRCSSTVTGQRDRLGRLIYKCKEASHVAIPRDLADGVVHARMVARLSRPDLLESLIPAGDTQAEMAKAQLAEQEEQMKMYAQMLHHKQMTPAQFATLNPLAMAEANEAKAVLAQLGAGSLLDGLDIGTPQVKAQWLALPLERQRALIDMWLEVTFVSHGKGIRDLPPEERVVITDRTAAAAA